MGRLRQTEAGAPAQTFAKPSPQPSPKESQKIASILTFLRSRKPVLSPVEGCSQRKGPMRARAGHVHHPGVNRRFMITVDFLASTSFTTPPKEGGFSGRTEKFFRFNTGTVRAEEAPPEQARSAVSKDSQGPSRSPRSGLSTLSKGQGGRRRVDAVWNWSSIPPSIKALMVAQPFA